MLENFYSVVEKFIKYFLIINKDDILIYISKPILNIVGNDSLGKSFNQLFLNSFSNNNITLSKENNFYYEFYPFNIDNDKFNLVVLEDLKDFNNTNVKIQVYKTILDSISDGVLMSDYEGKIVIYNKAMEKLEGLKSENLIGKYVWNVYNYHDSYKSEHRKIFETEKSVINKYEAHSFADGIPNYVSYSSKVIKINNNKIGVFSVCENEERLRMLLSETMSLKRKYVYTDISGKIRKEHKNGTTFTFSDIVGISTSTENLIREAQSIAWLENNILLIGETGTGKEVYAQSIHNYSKYDKPFVAINCAAIPENLFESILFGSVKGAYTGALDSRGLFEEAEDGTIFLDELNSMPISCQSKLLRALQEKKVRRVGGINTIPIKCRFISAVNVDPQELIKQKQLRLDLFYRIAAICLYIEPLRNRKEDIMPLAEFFIKNCNILMHKNIKTISPELYNLILNYSWPGNTREFEHFIENIVVRSSPNASILQISDIPNYLRNIIDYDEDNFTNENPTQKSLPEILKSQEYKIITKALKKNKNNISKTSKDLGIIRQSLLYRIKKLNILVKDGENNGNDFEQ